MTTSDASDRAPTPPRTTPAIDVGFLAGMAHELRTPLAAIGGYAELLEHGLHGAVSPAQVDGLRRIKHNQRVMVALIAAVMDYASAVAGDLDLELQQVDAADALERATHELASRFAERGVALETDGAESDGRGDDVAIAPVLADPDRLHQALRHLLLDALETSVDGGRVTARLVHAADGTVEVEVSGSGAPIPREAHEAVFRPFDRAGRSGRPPHALDLPLAWAIARAMGAELRVHEPPDGPRRAFRLRLQRAEV